MAIDVAELVERGRAERGAGRLVTALAYFEAALDHAIDPTAHIAAARTLGQLGLVASAKERLEEAALRWPATPTVLLELAGFTTARHSEDGTALDLYLRVIELDPGNPRAYAGAAFECLWADRLEQADELIAEGHASVPRTDAKWFLISEAEAALLSLRGERWSAASLLTEVLRETRDIERLSRCLLLLARRGRFDDLLDLLSRIGPRATNEIPVAFDFEWRRQAVESARRLSGMAHETEADVGALHLESPASYDEHRLETFEWATPLADRASKYYCFSSMLPAHGARALPPEVDEIVHADMESLRHWPALRQADSAYSVYVVEDCFVFKEFPRGGSCVVTREGNLIDELVPASSPIRLAGVIPIRSRSDEIDGLDEAFVLPDNNGWLSHYHTVVNICSSLFFFERLGLTCDVIVPGELTRVQRGILRASGVGEAGRVFSADEVSCVPIRRAYCGGRIGGQLLREWYQAIVSRLLGDDASTTPQGVVYISRDRAITRPLADEDRLEEELRRQFNARVVHMEDLSFEAQVRMMRSARLVVAPHGAGITNVIFASPESWVIELLPDRHARRTFRDLAAVAGHRYVPLVGKVDDADTMAWRVDAAKVIRVVEMILELSRAE